MGRLIYSTMCSLDGYTADERGDFSFAFPDAEVHAAANNACRGIGTFHYGRRMYEVMTAWELDPDLAAATPETADFAALWTGADKVVHSTTLTDVPTTRTLLERTFDPASVAAAAAASSADTAIAGPTLAAEALRAGIVDELQLIVFPAVVGGGLPALPPGLRAALALTSERRFASGAVELRYDVVGATS